MEYQYQRGDKLILELINSDEILEGEFLDGSNDRLSLINITPYKSKQRTSRGPYSYYRSDISSIRLLQESHLKNGHEIDDDSHNCNIILIKKPEYERLKEMSHKHIYITSMDSRYYDALSYVKNSEHIGIAAITTSYEKTAAINLLIISTWDQVYIVDFLLLNTPHFPVELKDILECEHVKKILHDSRLFNEVLTKRYNVKLDSLFDTKVADVAVRKKRGDIPQRTKSLSECLVDYFNLPISFLAAQDPKLEAWKQRPLSSSMKFRAAQMATFLITLKNYFEKILLEEFYKSVDDYSQSLGQCCMKDVPGKLFDKKLCDILQNVISD